MSSDKREKLRHQIVELRKQRGHHLIDESDYIEAVLALFDTYSTQKARDAHKDGYIRGVSDFSGWYMDASIPAQRVPIMPHVAQDLIRDYKPPMFQPVVAMYLPNPTKKEGDR